MKDLVFKYQQNMKKYQFAYLNDKVIDGEVSQLIELIYNLFFSNQTSQMEIKQKLSGLRQMLKVLLKKFGTRDDQNLSNEKIEELIEIFLNKLLIVREYLYADADAIYNNDPACLDKAEVVLAYPGFYALFVYRIAHELYLLNIRILPRLLTEYAHYKSGIDISAGAQIGKRCSIDHGTGIVIGETTVIGDDVAIYQGVTLGALSTRGGQKLKGIKRHPTIMNNVTIYANATILGGETIIGEGVTVKANAFITESVYYAK